VAVNFLHVNGRNYFVTVCLSKIVATITTSKKLVRMGRKFCLFVYYVKLIDIELWMAKEGATLNGGLEIWTTEGKIRRELGSNASKSFFFHDRSQEMVDFTL
jgi:hypothetical protein